MLDARRHINTSNDIEIFPVVKSYEVFALDCKQFASKDTLITERCFERFELRKVLINLYCPIL